MVSFLGFDFEHLGVATVTKEDILEQLIEDFLVHRGYFVRHNVKFLPSNDHPDFKTRLDSNHSDYVTAVAKLIGVGDRKLWETYPPFCAALANNPIKMIMLREIVAEVHSAVGTTLASTEIGRVLQLLRASEADL